MCCYSVFVNVYCYDHLICQALLIMDVVILVEYIHLSLKAYILSSCYFIVFCGDFAKPSFKRALV